MAQMTCDHVWHLIRQWEGDRSAPSDPNDTRALIPVESTCTERVKVSEWYCEKCRELTEDRKVLYRTIPVRSNVPHKRRRLPW